MLATASWLKAQIMMIYVKYKGRIAEMHIKLAVLVTAKNPKTSRIGL